MYCRSLLTKCFNTVHVLRYSSVLATKNINIQLQSLLMIRNVSSITGDYEKLWSAVTSGRGTGRGRKRTKPKDKESSQTGFGQFGKTWPGLNEPIVVAEKKTKKRYKENYLLKPQMSEVTATRPQRGRRMMVDDMNKEKTGDIPAWKKAFWAGERMYGQNLSRRGWSGRTWNGREFGPPEIAPGEVLADFHSIVIELRRVSNMTSGGRKRSQRAIVVVGNGKGAAGFAVGKGQSAISALKKARNKAAKYLYYVDRCDNRTLYHNFVTTHRKTTIRFERKPEGYGLRCHRIIHSVAEVLGIQDMRCKITGPTTPISVVRGTFQGLLSQESHEQLAERKGCHVVEYKEENSLRPVVVASPTSHAVKQAENMAATDDYDFDEIFDPYKGAHRPRKVKL